MHWNPRASGDQRATWGADPYPGTGLTDGAVQLPGQSRSLLVSPPHTLLLQIHTATPASCAGLNWTLACQALSYWAIYLALGFRIFLFLSSKETLHPLSSHFVFPLLSYLLLPWVLENLGHLACVSSHLVCPSSILSVNLKHVLFTFIVLCMCVGVPMTWCTHWGQRTTCESRFVPLTRGF